MVPAVLIAFVVIAFGFVMRMNRRAVGRLEHELAELAREGQ
jgi:hypothetical protein